MRKTRHRLARVGLGGVLALACAHAPPSEAPKKPPADAAGLQALARKAEVGFRECDSLRAKVAVQEEYALGAAVSLNWVSGGGGLLLQPGPEAALQRYLNTVGRNLAAQSSRPTLPWTFGVLRDGESVNAASAPGGYIFVTRAVLRDVENEAQLAGVLAHEIAHVTLQHAITRYDAVKVQQCRMTVAMQTMLQRMRQQGDTLHVDMLAAFTEASHGSGTLDFDKHVGLLETLTNKVVEKLVTEGYAAEDEYAADAEAVRLMLSAGYEPQEYLRFLDTLPEGGNAYAHHPDKAQRQERLRALLEHVSTKPGEFPELPAGTKGLKAPPLPADLFSPRHGAR